VIESDEWRAFDPRHPVKGLEHPKIIKSLNCGIGDLDLDLVQVSGQNFSDSYLTCISIPYIGILS
jgi:hypothetical protein